MYTGKSILIKMIKLSQDRKVQGTKNEYNSFGLPAIKTCPQATKACKAVCYAKRGFFAMPTQKKFYQNNYEMLKLYLMALSVPECAEKFAKEIEKNNKSGVFRWNISGDLFSEKYLAVIVLVAYLLPKIKFWTYTRSFNILKKYIKSPPENLQIIPSFDKDNSKKPSLTYFKEFHVVSYMGELRDAKKTYPNRKWVTCPEYAGKMKLQGACALCRLCFKSPNKIGIHFPTNKKEGRK